MIARGSQRRRPGPTRPAATRLAALALATLLVPHVVSHSRAQTAAWTEAWRETFGAGRLDPAHWTITSLGDFRERAVDIVEAPAGSHRYRLALSADTRGTRDETIKVLGVRSNERLSLTGSVRLSAELDWNGQENGSYLSAALVLAPQERAGDALEQPDWLSVEYVGVPPGKHARMVITARRAGRGLTVFAEGWPDRSREGRPIGLQRVTLMLHDGRLQVIENDSVVYESAQPVVFFDAAFLSFRLASHSNYPRRTVHFGPVRFERLAR